MTFFIDKIPIERGKVIPEKKQKKKFGTK